LSRVLNILSFVPIAVPGTVVAVGFLLLSVGTPLYGSIALLIIAETSRFLPFTTRLFIAAQMQIDKSLEEVAICSGIGGLTAFVRINIPLLAPSLMNGWLWVATQSLRDFTMPLLLATFATPVMANAIFDIFSLDGPSTSAAPIVLWTAASFVLTFSARRWVLSSWVR
jgi:iron(III) transport system permease protein